MSHTIYWRTLAGPRKDEPEYVARITTEESELIKAIGKTFPQGLDKQDRTATRTATIEITVEIEVKT